MDISVIICCYNSGSRLIPTLEHLAKQQLNGILCEVILVDNNCTDNTVEVAVKIWSENESPFPLLIMKENVPGLSNARKAGVLAAQGDLIVFCDDDNWLDQGFCYKAYNYLKADIKLGVIGGFSEAVSDTEIPNWFTSFQGGYAVGAQSLDEGDITNRGYVWGAASVYRRETLVTFYDLHLTQFCTGRSGKGVGSGDDSELCLWHVYAGFKLSYFSDLMFKHYIPQSRLSVDYCRSMYDGFSEAQIILNLYKEIYNGSKAGKRSYQLKLLASRLFNLLLGLVTLNEFYKNVFLLSRGKLFKNKVSKDVYHMYIQVAKLRRLRKDLENISVNNIV
jgi:glycosyltransferase involved in cell wall biosynthesis